MFHFTKNFLPIWLAVNFVLNSFGEKPQPPTLVEKWELAEKLDRLAEHRELLPKPVDQILNNLKDSLVVKFDCPEGMKVHQVNVVVKTRHIHWDQKLIINEQTLEVPPGVVGYYIWHPVISIGPDTMKVQSENFIMISPEPPPGLRGMHRSPLPDEAVLYHELLHGQLVFDAMTMQDWRIKACNGEFDLNARDDEHKVIPELVNTYLQNLAALDEDVYAVRIAAQKESALDGRFEKNVREMSSFARTNNWETICYYPDNSNVDPSSFDVQVKDNKIIATGRLIDKHKAGFMLLHFVPQDKKTR